MTIQKLNISILQQMYESFAQNMANFGNAQTITFPQSVVVQNVRQNTFSAKYDYS